MRASALRLSSVPYTPAVAKPTGKKLIAENRRARRDYELIERVEAGVVLTGTRGQVGPRRPRPARPGVRRRPRRRGVAHRCVDLRVRAGRAAGPPVRPRPKAPAPSRRDRLALREGAGEGPHARPDADVLQGRPREGRDRARARPRAVRQARVSSPSATLSATSSARSRAAAEGTREHEVGAGYIRPLRQSASYRSE